jgi:hypothetical protein
MNLQGNSITIPDWRKNRVESLRRFCMSCLELNMSLKKVAYMFYQERASIEEDFIKQLPLEESRRVKAENKRKFGKQYAPNYDKVCEKFSYQQIIQNSTTVEGWNNIVG